MIYKAKITPTVFSIPIELVEKGVHYLTQLFHWITKGKFKKKSTPLKEKEIWLSTFQLESQYKITCQNRAHPEGKYIFKQNCNIVVLSQKYVGKGKIEKCCKAIKKYIPTLKGENNIEVEILQHDQALSVEEPTQKAYIQLK